MSLTLIFSLSTLCLCPFPHKLSHQVQIKLQLYKIVQFDAASSCEIKALINKYQCDMDQQAKFTKEEILDLSSEDYRDIDCDSSSWLISSTLNPQKVKTVGETTENHTREIMCNHKVPVSAEELKIRSELEMDIEKDLEEEIKESIYHLALRLHRIYKQRKERNNNNARSEASPEYGDNYYNQLDKQRSSRAHCEVNISIRMEGGGAKVEIKEVNNEVAERGCETIRSNNSYNGFGAKKKFDWVKTLRKSGSSPVVVALNRFNNCTSKHNINEPNNVVSSCKFDCARRKNCGSSSNWKAKRSVDKKKTVQLVWKV